MNALRTAPVVALGGYGRRVYGRQGLTAFLKEIYS